MPRAPRQAIEFLTRYSRCCANLERLNQGQIQVACILFGADLIVPAGAGSADFELGAMVTLVRDWATETCSAGTH